MNRTILITGGCGFAGHHLVEHLLKNTNWNIVIVDKLTYASNGFNRLRDIKAFNDARVKVFATALDKLNEPGLEQEIGQVNYIIHMAAETHVDNSILNPKLFVEANVMGTFHILEFAKRQQNLEKFIYFSTDEVFGPAPRGIRYREWDRCNPGNPYAATKAAGEELALSYANTYKLPVFITRTMNLYGERQHPEKFIPLVVKKVMAGEEVMIHGTPDKKQSGSRFYIHCRNMADAILHLLKNIDYAGEADKFNIVGEKEVSNLELAQLIATQLNLPLHYKIVDFHSSRPGHDLRYALNGDKMKSLGWKPPISFEESLHKTINWMINPSNSKWLYI
jgi:dTDP-glucose 4,6-dehydratase